jgi:hypothetical protein
MGVDPLNLLDTPLEEHPFGTNPKILIRGGWEAVRLTGRLKNSKMMT